ncbi:MBL fold metallo-hydrolase [Dyella choica]|uniref:MBL fold metallo-hydrolase n=1 Tax=Dyella choica TaxID=1927959 RepID=UPI001E41CCEB|nr:MBL fold metallo-hydrolase [Dyella choica]
MTAAFTSPAATSHAQPASVEQLPGVYRFALGDAKITALSDGTIDLDLHQLLRGVTPDRLDALLRQDFLEDPVRTSINAFLVETGKRRVLVDTGSGELFGNRVGRLQESLAAAGVRPDQIDDILITHVHIDHVGGLAHGGKAVFTKATIHVGKPDLAFYFYPAASSRAHGDAESSASAVKVLKPYANLGRIKPFSGSEEIFPGMTGTIRPGHTPGSAFYTLESQGRKIVFIGDSIHSLAQLTDPSITIAFDTDSKLAEGVRTQAFADFASHRTLIAAPHLPFPGIGHIRQAGQGYTWVPVGYDDRPLTPLPLED